MGKELEKAAWERGHEVVLKITSSNPDDLNVKNLAAVDVAIEFSTPNSVIKNIAVCFEAKIPVVVGTTGWYSQLDYVKKMCIDNGNSLLYASNFSLGVNIFFEINRKLATMMNRYPDYEVSVEETHHIHKLDAPSGTAIALANDLVDLIDEKKEWKFFDECKHSTDLAVRSIRKDEVPGTHVVSYLSSNDKIEMKHEAFNRKGFADGAVIGAEWLKGKKGFFTMKDLLEL